LPPGYFDETAFDVCICGTGPAGLALALRLSDRLSVALLEAGGLDYSDESQELYRGTISGLNYYALDECRVRHFGGSSAHWSGWCSRMETRDFQPASHIPNLSRSGWPIAASDLDPYVRDAADFLGVDFDLPENRVEWAGRIDAFRDAGYAFSDPPIRLGEHYRTAVERSSTIRCFYHANLVDISLFDDLTRVRDVQVRDYAGGSHRVRARAFVLAAGGIENPRILLCANRQIPSGIGNARGLVGRHFAEHPKATAGRFLLEDEAKFSKAFAGFSVVTVESAELVRLGTPSFKVIVFGQDNPRRGFKSRLHEVVCRSAAMTEAVGWARGSDLSCRLDGAVGVSLEQYPNASSCVRLGDRLDRFGNPCVDLHWAITEAEREATRTAHLMFARSFAEARLGRVRLDDWLLEDQFRYPDLSRGEVGGCHHMGTTRMADDPTTGVVDRDCKVFDVANLYVAGSSVFSTTGHGNPTFTIVQLAQRLADHLNATLGHWPYAHCGVRCD
jgi:choline dehydrogenase-like flavoprotein